MLHDLQGSKWTSVDDSGKHAIQALSNADANACQVCQDKIIFFFNHARLCHVTSGYDQHEAGHSELQSIAEQCWEWSAQCASVWRVSLLKTCNYSLLSKGHITPALSLWLILTEVTLSRKYSLTLYKIRWIIFVGLGFPIYLELAT